MPFTAYGAVWLLAQVRGAPHWQDLTLATLLVAWSLLALVSVRPILQQPAFATDDLIAGRGLRSYLLEQPSIVGPPRILIDTSR